MSDEPVSVTFAADRFVGVARLVVGGVGARHDLSFEAVDELQLAVELVLRAGFARDTQATVSIDRDGSQLAVTIEPVDASILGRRLNDAGGEVELLALLARLVDGVVGLSEPGPAIVLRKALSASRP